MFIIPCTLNVGIVPLPNFSVNPTSISKVVTVGESQTVSVPVTVSNTGDGAGDYTATITGAEWITLSGDVQATVAAGGSKIFNVVIDAAELEPGEYSGTVVVTTNDAGHATIQIPCKLEKKPIGIESYTIDGIQTSVYPNPASGTVTVEANVIINDIQIINYMGQVVHTAIVNGVKANIDISNLSAGAYFVKVITEKSAHSSKLIIK
jgi:hypothetical protein